MALNFNIGILSTYEYVTAVTLDCIVLFVKYVLEYGWLTKLSFLHSCFKLALCVYLPDNRCGTPGNGILQVLIQVIILVIIQAMKYISMKVILHYACNYQDHYVGHYADQYGCLYAGQLEVRCRR